jgi:hypothetical protein
MAQPMTANPSPFDGTWRPDPQRPGPDREPDVLELVDGVYACDSCEPPYRVAADGLDHPVPGQPAFDTISITVVDERTVRKISRRGGDVVDSLIVVSADGDTKVETQTRTGTVAHPYVFRIESTRLSAGAPGGHAVSGRWRAVEMDLVNHEEDTVYAVVDGTFHMRDGFGRSFAAALDGSIAPYHGDTQFSSVSVTRIDERTIEERDRLGDDVVFVARWHVDPDGETMHVRFDDGHGHVMEQTGHRLR